MIENIVIFVLGALVATLFALLVIPVIWRRAARLIEERIRSTTPLSMSEIQSEKDMIRAHYAVQLRKVEIKYDNVAAEAARSQIELSRRDEAIHELKTELAAREETIAELELREQQLKTSILALERQVSQQSTAIREYSQKERQRALAETEGEATDIDGDVADTELIADGRKVEIAALKTQLENYKARVAEMRAELATRSVKSEGHASAVDELNGVLKSRTKEIAKLRDRVRRRRELSLERRRRAKELEDLLNAQRARVAEKTAALSAAELKRMQYEDDFKALEDERAALRASLSDLEERLKAGAGLSGDDGDSGRNGAEKRKSAARKSDDTVDAAELARLRENIADLAARITRMAAEDGDDEIRALIDAVKVDGPAGNGVDQRPGIKAPLHHAPLAERIREVDLTPGE